MSTPPPDPPGILRVPFAELTERLTVALLRLGFEPENAAPCATLFAETTRDGVYSHGLRRFPRFAAMVRGGVVQPNATPALVAAHGAVERWDGRSGPGNLNAFRSMQRAIARARDSGIGCVALANTNHWMRGGTYGWQAAEEGLIALCWTNTMPNLPPWGGTAPTLGNNPLILAVPRADGPVVLDIAMSQFSWGALESARARGDRLPVIGGFDPEGSLTRDPAAIEASQRPLPIGFWKGSGLAFLLDLIAAVLAGGRATCEIPADPLRESGMTQVFLALAPPFGRSPDEIAAQAIDFLRASPPAPSPSSSRPPASHPSDTSAAASDTSDAPRVRYPGEHTLAIRKDNLTRGIPVDQTLWDSLKEF